MTFEEFDRSKLALSPVDERVHDYSVDEIRPLVPMPVEIEALAQVAADIRSAADRGSAVILMMGAHLLRRGVQRYLIDLVERGLLSCIAMNGAGVIHDYELAHFGATTESVRRYIATGQFGLWRETGEINDIINETSKTGEGLGEAVGRAILASNAPHANISVLAAAFEHKVPVTVHVGIGYDIIHEHPNCDGAALGSASYRDFLRFAKIVEALEGGVVMNFGSAVMAPEVFLKALAMARNAARRENRRIDRFTSLVCDLRRLEFERWADEPDRNSDVYYFRPLKTMLLRTVAGGGCSHYAQADHAVTLPQLWTALVGRETGRTGRTREA